MMHEVRMPQLAQSVVEGEIETWLVKVGDRVEKEQPLAEIVTDKVNVELPSPVAGTVREILVPEGDTVPIGTLLLRIELSETGAKTRASTPVYSALTADIMKVDKNPEVAPAEDSAAEKAAPARPPGRPRAAPVARKVARDLGVDLATVTGTGPSGRITADDVRQAAEAAPSVEAVATRAPAAEAPAPAGGEVEYLPYTGRRRQIGQRLARAKQTIPHASCVEAIDVEALVAVRAEHKPRARQRGVRLTYLPYLAQATLWTLQRHPIFNASLEEAESRIALKKHYDLGIAVDTADGLIVPVLPAADRKTLLQLATELEQLATRARQGQLTPSDVQGSTITLSNVGADAVLFSVGVINAPEVALLNFHRMEQRPVIVQGGIVVRWQMYITLTFDHRIADGGHAVRFLEDFKQRIEDVASWAVL